MRLDLRKLRFRQPKLVATHLCLLFGSRESRHYARANTFMGPDPSTAAGKAFLDMLGVFAEFETSLRRERQMEGIANAKAKGVYKGRPRSIDSEEVRRLK